MIPFAAGLGSGLVIALLTKLVESSRLAIGPYAFYGNGALIVPPIGAALAIYALWTWQIAAGRPGRELALSALGLYLGIGAVGLPSLPALLFTGVFAIPGAILAAPFIWFGVRASSTGRRVLIGVALVVILLALGLGLPLLFAIRG